MQNTVAYAQRYGMLWGKIIAREGALSAQNSVPGRDTLPRIVTHLHVKTQHSPT